MTDDHALVFDSVTYSFDEEPVLQDVSFRAAAGDHVAVVGPSGAGKTTLLRLANRSLRPDSGRILLDGDPVASGDVALAYQSDTLVDRRTALANVLVGRLGNLPWWRGLVEPLVPRNPDPAVEILSALGLSDEADVRVDELSAGERQRVSVARAVMQDAPVVLADEPTANLDPSTRAQVIDLLGDLVGERPLVTVLHDVALAREQFDTVVGLADGRVQFVTAGSDVTDPMLSALFDDAGESDTASDSRRDARSQPGDTTPDEPVPKWYA